MGGLEFDEGLGEQLEVVYRTRDILRRRRLVHEALAAQPGERILDVGCGPGFYVAELLEAVGPEGSVVGIDVSPPMLAIAAHRTEAHPNVAFHEAIARVSRNSLVQVCNQVVRGVVLSLISDKIARSRNSQALMRESLRHHEEVLEAIRESGDLSDETVEALKQAVEEFTQGFEVREETGLVGAAS